MTARGQAIRRLVYIAAMTAILEIAKFVLNGIPNVELITVLIIVFTRHFGWKMTLPSVLLFALLECIWWGIGTWSTVYFVIWPVLVFLTVLLSKSDSYLTYCVLAAAFGLLFGAFCALFTWLIGGLHAAIAWWIAGIPYDLIHCVSNFITCALLYKPLMKALEHIAQQE